MQFQALDFRGQVRVLSDMAKEAVNFWDFPNSSVKFINHGENATFKVTDSKGGEYLLRLHRPGYHSLNAIKEELNWLHDLKADDTIPCQSPILSRKGEYIENVSAKKWEYSRYVDVLKWQNGSIRYQNLSVESYYLLGQLTAKLQNSSPKKTKYRKYWTAEGLLGPQATFGSPFDLKGQIPNDDVYLECRSLVSRKLLNWQKKFPQKQGMIHADLHFGNIVWNGANITPIDFDDCGLGFYMYDCTTTFISSEILFSKGKAEEYTMSYLMGYMSERDLDNQDIEILKWLMVARKLGMLSWLYHRKDNPVLIPYFKKAIKGNMPIFKKCLEKGPDFPWLPL